MKEAEVEIPHSMHDYCLSVYLGKKSNHDQRIILSISIRS